MTETNFLGLKYIQLASTRWFQDFNSNLARLDLIGKALRLQQGAGQSLALRAELANGTLAEFIRGVPNNSGGVDVYVGRQQTGDRVIIQAPTGGIGDRVSAVGNTLPLSILTEGSWLDISGSVSLSAGSWDIESHSAIRVDLVNPATAHPQIQVVLGIFAAGSGTPLATARFTADVVAAVDASRSIYQTLSAKALGAPGGTSYSLKMTYYIINASFVDGDGTQVSVGIDTTHQPQNHILATRIA